MKSKRYLPLAVGVTGGLAGIWTYRRFRRDLRAARERVAAGGRVIQTACGPIEVGETGCGLPILGIHGAAGGYDQCLLLGRLLLDRGCRIIAPSRFGYLNTPIPEDSSIEAQADAYACLLDALHVDRVAVLAMSAGGPSGLHFALRHPERTAALVLVSAISYGGTPEAEVRWYRTRHSLARGSDGLYWLGLAVARVVLLARRDVSSAERVIAWQILQAGLPLRERMPGTRLDQVRRLSPDLPIEQIRAPALVIHARDDPLVLFAHSMHAVSRIPGAKLLAFERGGHSLLGHYDEIQARIVALLAEVAC
jgi:pimeloyl-ACP methyl ester carboxylesterase